MHCIPYRIALIALVFGCPLFLVAAENRTWTDDTGLFKIEATLSQIEDNSVKLKTTDGRIVTLPMTKLSEADQRYVANLATKNPFENSNSSAATNRHLGNTPLRTESAFVSFAESEIQEVDISSAREAGGNPPSVWSCEADPAPPLARPEDVARLAFRLQSVPRNIMPRRTDFFVDSMGSKAVTAFHVGDLGGRNMETSYTLIALGHTDSGKTVSQKSPLKLRPFGFSPDGTRCIFQQETWEFPAFGKRTILHVAEHTPSGWLVTASFEPFVQLKRTNNRLANFDLDIYMATWADDDHLLVQSDNNLLILLDVNTGNVVWRIRIERHGDVSLSPNRKYCFLPVGNKMILVETMTGKTIGGVDDARFQKFRFSPDGKRFAFCNKQGIILGDLATGALETPFFVSGSDQGHDFFWLDDQYLFIGGEVVDTASKTTVWSYTGYLRDNVKFANGYCWCIFDRIREGAVLTALMIPHAMVNVKNFPANGNADFVLKPGMSVSLAFDSSIADKQQEVYASIEKRVAANGWILDPTAPISIVMKIEDAKSDKAEYTAGRGPIPMPSPFSRGTAIDFQPERYSLSIVQEDKDIWNITHLTRPPQSIKLDEIRDSSLQEVVDRAMEAQNYKEWIDKISIPKTISRKREEKGESKLTEHGIENVSK